MNRGFLVGQARHGAGQLAKTVEEKRVRERSGVGRFAIVFEALYRRTDGKRTHDPKLSAELVASGAWVAVHALDLGGFSEELELVRVGER